MANIIQDFQLDFVKSLDLAQMESLLFFLDSKMCVEQLKELLKEFIYLRKLELKNDNKNK